MANYKIINAGIVQRTSDGAFIPVNSEVKDSREYQAWLAMPNTPDPADALVLYDVPTPLQLLFVKRAANMQSTSDQQFTKIFIGTLYKPTAVIGKRASGGASVACAGGVYTAASKGGDALVAAAQSWINLTADKKIVNASLAALVDTDIHNETPYLSLTTGSTGACTADIFIYGIILD